MSFLDYLKNVCSYEDLVGFWNVYATEVFPLTRIYGSLEEFCSVNNCDTTTLGEMLTGEGSWRLGDDVCLDNEGKLNFFDSLEGSPIKLDVLARIMIEREVIEYRYLAENGTLEA